MDGDIQDSRSWVHDFEGQANRAGEKLKQLESIIKEEGLSCVECMVSCCVSEYYRISYEGFIVCTIILWQI